MNGQENERTQEHSSALGAVTKPAADQSASSTENIKSPPPTSVNSPSEKADAGGKASTKPKNGGDKEAHVVVIKREQLRTPAERAEQDRFFYLDGQITEWVSKTLENCAALDEIYRRGLWKWGGYKSYAHYIAAKFRYAQSTAYQFKEAGRVYNVLKDSTTVESSTLPTSERQLRPLLDIKDSSKIVEVWNKANELYSQTGKGVTEKAVASAKRVVLHVRADELPPIMADQLADQFVKQFRSKWVRCLEGERSKLLGKVLLDLKGFYEELDFSNRTPRLTAVFNLIETEKPEAAAKATVQVHPRTKQEPDKGKAAGGARGRAYWDRLNWELRNADLANVWHKKEQTVRNMRCRFKYGAAVKCEPEQYQEKLAKEKAKAKAAGQSHTPNEN